LALPVIVVCGLLGVPEPDRARFRDLARDLADVLDLRPVSLTPDIRTLQERPPTMFEPCFALRRMAVFPKVGRGIGS
jgi:cytochrome P450